MANRLLLPGHAIAPGELMLYRVRVTGNHFSAFMEYFDINLWGVFSLPVGLIFCFGPALLLWMKMEAAGDSDDRGKDGK